MTGGVKFAVEGLSDVLQVFDELAREIGDKEAKSKILVPATRKAMQPVLRAAQQNAPVDTGGLRLSLQIEARRPNRKDQRSKYISNTDAVIAVVTTASGKKLKKMSQGKGLEQSRRRLASMEQDAHVGAYRAHNFMGVDSDARAIAQEFGTARMKNKDGNPFMRPALENNATQVANTLGKILGDQITKYKSRKFKK
jgi:HK97 gp10 family phage protein